MDKPPIAPSRVTRVNLLAVRMPQVRGSHTMPDLSMFANSSDTHEYPAGHVFFTAGDEGDVMYVVVAGEVEILIREKIVETIGAGGIFGEMALIDSRPRSAAARAKTIVKAAAIDQRHFLYLVQTHPLFSIEVMNVMTDRLRLLDDIVY
jgi:CRP/FNR family transcriptional regulator, cyclic AMP receptor protein